MKPLEGVVVLDLTRYLAGPYCALLLGGLGAEVIKVEPPAGGDFYRDRPPFGGPHGVSLARQTDDDIGLLMLHRARCKKSVTLNLRAPAGRELCLRLAARADVVVENFLPGTLDRMGLGFATLEAANPKVVLCSISGFGQDGPYREWRALDPVIQAMSGISSITGHPGDPPVRCGASISDTAASLHGVIGILAALRARERTGRGDWVDVSMLDGSFFLLPDVLEFVTAGEPAEPLGNGHQGTVPFNVYRATDGWVALCAVTARDWENVLRALGRSELTADPRFHPDPMSRRAHRAEIDTLVGEWVGRRPASEAVDVLQRHQVPAGPVRTLPELLEDPDLRGRGMVVDLEHPVHGRVPGARGAGMPIKFRRHPASFDTPAPSLGAHNAEVYGGRLGLDEAAINALKTDGVI